MNPRRRRKNRLRRRHRRAAQAALCAILGLLLCECSGSCTLFPVAAPNVDIESPVYVGCIVVVLPGGGTATVCDPVEGGADASADCNGANTSAACTGVQTNGAPPGPGACDRSPHEGGCIGDGE